MSDDDCGEDSGGDDKAATTRWWRHRQAGDKEKTLARISGEGRGGVVTR